MRSLLVGFLGLVVSMTAVAKQHFPKVMVVVFENMSYAEIKNEPVFKKLVTYTGNELTEQGRLIKSLRATKGFDSLGNGYAFFSTYYNNHAGGLKPTRPSQPNYLAMTSGSIQHTHDNQVHNYDVDNLGNELLDAGVSWNVYADNLPDPKAPIINSKKEKISHLNNKVFKRDVKKSEQENDDAEDAFFAAHNPKGYQSASGCFVAYEHSPTNDNNHVYVRKHEPFISYLNIQNAAKNCDHIINSRHLIEDIDNMPQVSFYIPDETNDGHNGTLAQRRVNANRFLSKMMGMDARTGELLPNASDASFQKFMGQGGLLVITFDEPSVTGNPDHTTYTMLAGKMINSGAYPNAAGQHGPVCYPTKQGGTQDQNGHYPVTHCNHYNLLKLIERNFGLRGLNPEHTSAGYKIAYPLDHGVEKIWQ